MKKLFLILIMTATVATAWAQSQLSTVRGKTKDGKTIKVDYYKGTVEDVIHSVKYQLVDELQANVKDLQGRTKTLQTKLDAAEKQVKDLQKQVNNSGNSAEEQQLRNQLTEKDKEVKKLKKDIADLNSQIEALQKDDMSETVASLREQLTEKEATISLVNKQVVKLNADVVQLNKDKEELNQQIETLSKQGDKTKEIQRLNKQVEEKNAQISQLDAQIAKNERVIDSLKRNKTVVVPNDKDKQMQELRNQIATKDATINSLKKDLANCGKGITKPAKTPVIGLEVGFGPAFPGSSVAEPWAKEVKSCLQADVYFGTARLSESFPISVEAGLGFRKFGMAARLNEYNTTLDAVDADGDSYQAIYAFEGLDENLSLSYFDIPIRLCFGQPAKDRVTAYAKLGLTPSIKVASTFEGAGKYSLKGYYPQWDVTIENVEPLGFGSDMNCYDGVEPEIKGFNLWGNVAFGAYVPFKGSPIVLNAGVKLDYPFMGFGTINAASNLPDGKAGLLQNGGKVIIPSVEVGLVYTLK
jgi:peptidoglycan hydrolase CwlO-like protein